MEEKTPGKLGDYSVIEPPDISDELTKVWKPVNDPVDREDGRVCLVKEAAEFSVRPPIVDKSEITAWRTWCGEKIDLYTKVDKPTTCVMCMAQLEDWTVQHQQLPGIAVFNPRALDKIKLF